MSNHAEVIGIKSKYRLIMIVISLESQIMSYPLNYTTPRDNVEK